MVELAIQKPYGMWPIHILLIEVDLDISVFICLYILDDSCIFVDNISYRLWHRIVILVYLKGMLIDGGYHSLVINITYT